MSLSRRIFLETRAAGTDGFVGLHPFDVLHPDVSAFSANGRHLAGGHVQAASIDTALRDGEVERDVLS